MMFYGLQAFDGSATMPKAPCDPTSEIAPPGSQEQARLGWATRNVLSEDTGVLPIKAETRTVTVMVTARMALRVGTLRPQCRAKG